MLNQGTTRVWGKDVGCRSNFDPSRPLYAQDTSFSVKSSLMAVRQGCAVKRHIWCEEGESKGKSNKQDEDHTQHQQNWAKIKTRTEQSKARTKKGSAWNCQEIAKSKLLIIPASIVCGAISAAVREWHLALRRAQEQGANEGQDDHHTYAWKTSMIAYVRAATTYQYVRTYKAFLV